MRKQKWMVFLLLPPLFLTGCWDKKDPEDRTFIISLGVDDSPAGYRVTFAPANIETGEARTYTAESKTLAGAVAQMDTQTSRMTDLGQLKTIILNRELLEEAEKLDALLQELARSQTVSEKVMLLATEEPAAKCIEAVLEEDGKTGLFLWDFYKNTAGEVAVTKGMDLDTFLTEWTEQDGNAVFPRISLQDDKLKLGGGIAVSGEKVYPLSDREERGYLFLLGEAEGALLEGEYLGETLPLSIGRSAAEYGFTLQEENILCTVTLPLEGTLQSGKGAFHSAEERDKIETLFEDIIKEEIRHTMRIAEREKKDLFGILPRLYQAEPELSKGISREALWQSLVFEIQPQLELKDMGRKR